ncbi:MAG TPA: AI-2E family transporter [Chthoniobacterales bacterium]|nr:AI-2E family transporter [Chthoniobacterales bacterium]
MKKYPTHWQRKTMWASLTAIFVVVLISIVGTVLWVGANVVAFLQPILIPVAIAAILAYLLDPVVTYLAHRGFGRTKAVLFIFALAFFLIGGLIAWVVPLISVQSTSLARQLPAFTVHVRDRVADLMYRYDHTFGLSEKSGGTGPTSGLVNWLLAGPTPAAKPTPAPFPKSQLPGNDEVIAPAPTKLTSADRQRIQDWVQKQLPAIEKQLPDLMGKLWLLVKTSVGGFLGVTGFLLSLVMVPIYSFFLLKERPSIERRWKEYLPLRNSPLKDEVATTLSQINSYVIAYFRGQLLVCLVDGLLIGLALTIYGLNFAPLIGLIVVPLTMIPYLGIVICWIPAVIIAAAQWGDWWHPFWVTIIFLAVQNLEGLFYAPRIVGNSVGLHPMTVIVSIFIWGLLIGGLLGPLLAIPLTATIKVLLARYVWGPRLREEVMENIEEVPVVEAEQEPAPAR